MFSLCNETDLRIHIFWNITIELSVVMLFKCSAYWLMFMLFLGQRDKKKLFFIVPYTENTHLVFGNDCCALSETYLLSAIGVTFNVNCSNNLNMSWRFYGPPESLVGTVKCSTFDSTLVYMTCECHVLSPAAAAALQCSSILSSWRIDWRTKSKKNSRASPQTRPTRIPAFSILFCFHWNGVSSLLYMENNCTNGASLLRPVKDLLLLDKLHLHHVSINKAVPLRSSGTTTVAGLDWVGGYDRPYDRSLRSSPLHMLLHCQF